MDLLQDERVEPKESESERRVAYHRFYFHRATEGNGTVCGLCPSRNLPTSGDERFLLPSELPTHEGGEQGERVRIVIVSDTHGRHAHLQRLPACDILIHAGDVFDSGGDRSAEHTSMMLDSFREWIGSQPAASKILVCGNHDMLFEGMSSEQIARVIPEVTMLTNSPFQSHNLSLWGSPFSKGSSNNKAFQSEDFRDATFAAAEAVRGKVDVLVTHGHCEDLRAIVQPRMLHIMGHLHEHHECFVFSPPSGEGNPVVVACSPLIDRRYEPSNCAMVVDCCYCPGDATCMHL